MATQVMAQTSNRKRELTALKKIVVGHDFSDSADRAFADAMALAGRFNTQIVIVHATEVNADKTSRLRKQAHGVMDELVKHVAQAGYSCKDVLRSGTPAATLCDVVDEECPDLLLVGAYGKGSQDRATLGSTAELLLRSIPCPVVTYGPKFDRPLFQDGKPFSILVPIELPCDRHCLSFAIEVAKLFHAKLEILHVIDMNHADSMPHAFQDMQYECEEIASQLRMEGVEVAGSVLFGKPDAAIVSRSQELQSSLILMPLETRGHLSSTKSDNVAANVIRNSNVPVMTYRID